MELACFAPAAAFTQQTGMLNVANAGKHIQSTLSRLVAPPRIPRWNQLVFGGRLPHDLPIVWNPRLLSTAGQVSRPYPSEALSARTPGMDASAAVACMRVCGSPHCPGWGNVEGLTGVPARTLTQVVDDKSQDALKTQPKE